jgi:hypothetical protein
VALFGFQGLARLQAEVLDGMSYTGHKVARHAFAEPENSSLWVTGRSGHRKDHVYHPCASLGRI